VASGEMHILKDSNGQVSLILDESIWGFRRLGHSLKTEIGFGCLDCRCLINAVVSMGRCNTCSESTRRGLKT
jgi:hypothetical protein